MKSGYRYDIDGLRALAILLVVGYHFSPQRVSGGFVGVDIFFVISGFLISTIIFRELESDNFSLIDFFGRRIKRIYPALILVLSSAFLIGWFVLLPEEFKQLGKHISAGGIFASNVLLWSESGYFDSVAETKPLLHLWSLAVEEQFYIIWPILLVFLWKRKNSFGVLTLTIATFSFFCCIFLLKLHPTANFFLPFSRFWELMLGALLAYIELCAPHVSGKYKNFQSTLGVFFLGLSFLTINRLTPFPSLWTLLPTLGTFFVISAGQNAIFNRYFFSNNVLVWFGLISFPLYLWHWTLLSFARILTGSPSADRKITLIVASIILSYLTYNFIEKSVRFGELGSRKRTRSFLIVSLLVVALVGYLTYLREGFPNRIINKSQVADAAYAIKQLGPIQEEYVMNDICLKKYPFDLPKSNHFFCTQSKPGNPTVILLGNSFANHHYPGFASNENLKKQTFLSVGICDFAKIDFKTPEGFGNLCESEYVRREQNWIESILENNKTIKYAIVDGLQNYSSEDYINGVKTRIDSLESHGLKVIVFVPHFIPYFDIRSCVPTRFSSETRGCAFDKSRLDKFLQDFNSLKNHLAKSNPNVLFFDQNTLFCSGTTCSYAKNGIPLSRDMQVGGRGGHYSVYGSKELVKIFATWAKDYVPELVD